MKKICIIGGGVSGLTAAFLLKKRGFDVALFDRAARVGGNIQTVAREGFLIEQGPNSLLKSPRLVDLIRELKLEAEILPADAAAKKRYVLQDGKLAALPMSIAKMALGSFFSTKAKLRLLKEPFIKSESGENESVAAFFERRLGREIVEKAADPFISGIYAGDPEKLAIKSAFPRLFELEKNYGSLFLGSLRAKAEKPPPDFPRTFTFKRGLQTLTEGLAENLGESLKTNAEVRKIEKLADGRFAVFREHRQPAGSESESAKNFDAFVIATPAGAAANLIENLDENLSAQLKSVYYPPVALVYFGVKKESLAQDLDGFGFLIPGSEKREILGTIWNSAVFPNRAPDGFHLLTTFVGGARNPQIFERSDAEIFEIVNAELREILGLREKPSFAQIKRWPRAIPQYNVGYDKIETAIENFEDKNKGIFFCSNFYKGISVGDCIKNAYKTADEIERFMKN